ncbi:MAG: glycosyltransferase family 1 protein, partial [Sphingopyxis sp.]|nr:glycosyltransferase family 1 protein [Sphingopyxis sp.]
MDCGAARRVTGARTPVRILHLHSSFSLGGKEARAVRLMNLMGPRARHVILSAVPEAMGARDAIDPGIDVRFPADAPPLHGKPSLKRYRALTRYMRRFDLVLSYNWGAMDGVMAHRLFSPFQNLPPMIHHEDGFNEDESVRRNWKRNGFRRLALPTTEALVGPST